VFRENKQFTQKNINEILSYRADPPAPRALSFRYLMQVDRIRFTYDDDLNFWIVVRTLDDKYQTVSLIDVDSEDGIKRLRQLFEMEL
jgi:hypothetical protein